MWCPSTSVQHCAPYTPGWLIAVLDIQASPSQLTHRSLLHTLDGAPATPVPRLHLAKAPLPLGSPSLLCSYRSLHTYSAVGSSILTAVAAHSTPLRLDVYYISLQLQQASAQYIPTLTLGTFRHRTAGTFPVPSFGHHSIGPQKRNWQGCLYRCWSWARYPSPHCGSGSTRTQGAATVGGPRFFTSIPWGIAAVFVPSK